MEILFDVAGWIGTVLILLAYLLLSFKKIKPGKTYQLINLFGALFMAIGLLPKNAWFSFALQVVWGVIAIVAIVKLSMKQPKRKRK